MEGSAETISEFEVIVMPGILQTREYAEVMIDLYPPHDQAKRDGAVKARLRRQQILSKDSPPAVRIVLDEGVIAREVGGKKVMREQLSHLSDVVAKGVDLRIIPFSTGGHVGETNGFTVLEIPKPAVFPAEIPNPGFVYLELSSGPSYLDDTYQVEQHLTKFTQLREVALSVDKSVEMLRIAANRL